MRGETVGAVLGEHVNKNGFENFISISSRVFKTFPDDVRLVWGISFGSLIILLTILEHL